MSKTRTGRKGRARLAIASHLELEKTRRLATQNGNGDGPSDDQNLFLDLAASAAEQAQLATDAGSGVAAQVLRGLKNRERFLHQADLAMAKVLDEESTFGDDELLDRLNALAKGQGTGGELFSQGQELTALPDSVDTADGAPGIFANADAAALTAAEMAGVAGESSLAADADFPQLAGGAFPHYYMTAAGVTAASSKGIAYLPSGPAANFIPANHGLAVGDTLTLTVNVPQSELYAVGTEANLGISAIGTMLAADTLAGTISTHTQASAIFKLSGGTNVDGVADGSFVTEARGAEIRIADSADNSTLLNIKFRASGYNQDGLGDADIDSGAVGASAGDAILYNVDSATQVSVIEAGAVAGVNDTAANMAANIEAAINAWRAVYGDMISVAVASNQLTVTMNKLRGESGNASTDEPLRGCTITALVTKFGAQQPLDTANKEEQWFLSSGDGDIRHVAFASGDTDIGPPFNFEAPVLDGAEIENNPGVNVMIRSEAGKYASADIQLIFTVGTNDNEARNGLVVAWSLTPA